MIDMREKNEVSVKQIAEQAGVSSSAVSLVLNQKGDEFRIAEKTRERILQIADELGYRHVARASKRNKSFSQGLICIFCTSNFKGPTVGFYEFFQQYIKEQRLPYETVLFPYEANRLADKAAYITGGFAAGAVMLTLGDEDIYFLENNKFDLPIVLNNRIANGYCSVLNDDYSVGSNAMSHFIKRGHKRFGMLSPNYSSRALSLRSVGYWDKFQSSFKQGEATAVTAVVNNDGDQGGYDAMKKLIESPTLPTAIFLPIDNMVGGVMRCIHENGYKVPQDFELISFGNKDTNTIVEPAVSSFVPPLEDMSINCAKILHNAISSGIMTDNIRMSFAADCIFRASCPAS